MKRILIFLAAVFLLTMLVACNEDEVEEEKETIVPVETVEAKEDDLVIHKTVNGRTEPKNITPIVIQNPGEIDVLEVKNGDKVKEDDLIATLVTQVGKQNIYAPKNGEIANLDVKEGDMTSNEDPLAIVIDLDEVTIKFNVTSNDRSLFKLENKQTTIINDEEYEAEITSIGTMPGETGLYEVEAVTDNKDNNILPGMVAVMQIPEKRVKEAIIVPTEAIVEEIEGVYVYIVKDDKAVKTEITVKESQSDKSAIEGEVEVGDEIVINGQLTLFDGAEVDVVEEGE